MAWLACAAVLLSAVMPTLSHAFAPNRADAVLAQICSPSKLMAGADAQGPHDKSSLHMQDCPYCRLQFDTPVLPTVPVPLKLGTIAARHPTLFYQSPTPLFSWVAANPRAPPLLT